MIPKDEGHPKETGESAEVLQQVVCQWLIPESLSVRFCCQVLPGMDGTEPPAHLLGVAVVEKLIEFAAFAQGDPEIQ